jgi:hypothetical protein
MVESQVAERVHMLGRHIGLCLRLVPLTKLSSLEAVRQELSHCVLLAVVGREIPNFWQEDRFAAILMKALLKGLGQVSEGDQFEFVSLQEEARWQDVR